MNTFEYELLSMLREGYRNSLSLEEQETWQRKERGKSESPRQFYLACYQDNLIRTMEEIHRGPEEFGGGAGKELDDKMCAVRSSSAMAFNILGNLKVTIVDRKKKALHSLAPGEYRIQYEYKAPTLNIAGNPAHLDALLTPEDGDAFVACEMKLMEWLTKKPPLLEEKYLDETSYFDFGDGAACAFASVARELNKAASAGQFSSFEFAQMFRHTVGLYNKLKKGEFGLCKKFMLLNCVWMPDIDSAVCQGTSLAMDGKTAVSLKHRWEEEEREFALFEGYMARVADFFAKGEIVADFSLQLCKHSDLIDAIDWTGREGEREKLKRYW